MAAAAPPPRATPRPPRSRPPPGAVRMLRFFNFFKRFFGASCQFVIVGVCADPDPENLTALTIAENTIFARYPRRPQADLRVDHLEIEAGVERVALELSECFESLLLHIFRQRV